MDHEKRKKKDNKAKRNAELNGKYNSKYVRQKETKLQNEVLSITKKMIKSPIRKHQYIID
jgi:hypothetical protein